LEFYHPKKKLKKIQTHRRRGEEKEKKKKKKKNKSEWRWQRSRGGEEENILEDAFCFFAFCLKKYFM
jgi:hypothetical protein